MMDLNNVNFYRYITGEPPALHSIPTRRSSDLRHGVCRELGELRRQDVPAGCVARKRTGAEGPQRAEEQGCPEGRDRRRGRRSEEHTSELQSRRDIVRRLLLEKKKPPNHQFVAV